MRHWHEEQLSGSDHEGGKVGQSDVFSKVPEDRTAVDNILRVNHGNQMRLGLMADAKANIMITGDNDPVFIKK